MKSKIKELFENEKTIYFFDLDGVLAPLEYGEYNHYYYNDEEWAKELVKTDFYANIPPFKTMQNFIEKKKKENIYVITKVMNDIELDQKKKFLIKNYHILENHIFLVYENHEKLEKMKDLKKEYPNLEDKYFVMIDDTVDVLNHIMEHSSFSTVHISSFLQ